MERRHQSCSGVAPGGKAPSAGRSGTYTSSVLEVSDPFPMSAVTMETVVLDWSVGAPAIVGGVFMVRADST